MNQLHVSLHHSITTLAANGWSARKIARELGVPRETVGRYLQPGVPESKPAIPPTGSAAASAAKPAPVPAGSKPGRTSQCAPLSAVIEQGWRAGLSAQRIYQDLVAGHAFTGGYDAVKRFVRQRAPRTELPFRRMECAPGQEVQVDFGQGAWVLADGQRRRPHLFRAGLSHSRKGYREVVWRQTAESFIRCLENAFRHFGGVPATVVPDNLKAGVLQADWYDPELHPKLAEFARHYGPVILPTKPVMPRHKGKVEAGVKYAQNNAVKGRSFASLTAHNSHLSDWEKNVADTRIHGTIRQQVGKLFEAVERPALQPLPAGLFPGFEDALRRVQRDGYVEFKKADYAAPPEYVSRQVWVRQEARRLRIYNTRREPIALHALAEPGKFTTNPAHLHSRKRHIIERGADYLLGRCRLIGPLTGNRQQICALAAGNYLRAGKAVLFPGPPGIGKTHWAQALGYEAIKPGQEVRYRSIFDLGRDFRKDEAFKQQDKTLRRDLKPALVIMDDLGLKAWPKQSGEYLLEVVMRRYENRSPLMTSNRPLEDWGQLLSAVPTAGAILDRFLHHAMTIAITGRSYRIKDALPPAQESKKTPKPNEPLIAGAAS